MSSLRRLGIIGGSLLLTVALAGCSTIRFGYSQGVEVGHWWLDRYLDFNDEQSALVRERLGEWFAWHRRTQLPDYAAWLERVRQDSRSAVTPAQMCRWFDDLQQRSDVAVAQALPMLGEVLRDLSASQVAYLNRQYAKRNREFREEFLQEVPEERLRASIKRAVERFENLYGKLEAPQREVIAKGVRESPFDAERWAIERETRQRDVVQAILRMQAERAAPAQAATILRGVADRWLKSPSADYREYQMRLTDYNCRFAAAVHNATTPAQREAAARRLKGWADDARSLAGLPPGPP